MWFELCTIWFEFKSVNSKYEAHVFSIQYHCAALACLNGYLLQFLSINSIFAFLEVRQRDEVIKWKSPKQQNWMKREWVSSVLIFKKKIYWNLSCFFPLLMNVYIVYKWVNSIRLMPLWLFVVIVRAMQARATNVQCSDHFLCFTLPAIKYILNFYVLFRFVSVRRHFSIHIICVFFPVATAIYHILFLPFHCCPNSVE